MQDAARGTPADYFEGKRDLAAPALAAGPEARGRCRDRPGSRHRDVGRSWGWQGLEATYEAVRLGKRVGLANKEVLVAGGKLVIEAMRPPARN